MSTKDRPDVVLGMHHRRLVTGSVTTLQERIASLSEWLVTAERDLASRETVLKSTALDEPDALRAYHQDAVRVRQAKRAQRLLEVELAVREKGDG